MQNIFIPFTTLKQIIHYFIYVQCSQNQEDPKASPERGKPESDQTSSNKRHVQKTHRDVFKENTAVAFKVRGTGLPSHKHGLL